MEVDDPKEERKRGQTDRSRAKRGEGGLTSTNNNQRGGKFDEKAAKGYLSYLTGNLLRCNIFEKKIGKYGLGKL